jgi:hypothetical protein
VVQAVALALLPLVLAHLARDLVLLVQRQPLGLPFLLDHGYGALESRDTEGGRQEELRFDTADDAVH